MAGRTRQAALPAPAGLQEGRARPSGCWPPGCCCCLCSPGGQGRRGGCGGSQAAGGSAAAAAEPGQTTTKGRHRERAMAKGGRGISTTKTTTKKAPRGKVSPAAAEANAGSRRPSLQAETGGRMHVRPWLVSGGMGRARVCGLERGRHADNDTDETTSGRSIHTSRARDPSRSTGTRRASTRRRPRAARCAVESRRRLAQDGPRGCQGRGHRGAVGVGEQEKGRCPSKEGNGPVGGRRGGRQARRTAAEVAQ